jgi:hypothetical protein
MKDGIGEACSGNGTNEHLYRTGKVKGNRELGKRKETRFEDADWIHLALDRV